MSLAWVVEQRTGNSGWIDTIWTFGVGFLGVACTLVPLGADSPANLPRQCLVAIAVALWALRLGLHIASRTAGITDDPRYAALRRGWGASAAWQMWLLVQKQAVVSIPLVLAIFLAAHNPAPTLRLQDGLAILIFILAITGEGVADQQLRRFRRSSPGGRRICQSGLWRWSRHPNYFFEWFGWVGYPLVAIDLSGGYAGDGSLSLRRPACIGSSCTSPAFRRLKNTCCEREATTSVFTRRAPMLFSPGRHARLQEQCLLEPHSGSDWHWGACGVAGSGAARRSQNAGGPHPTAAAKQDLAAEGDFARGMTDYPIAINTREANDQHYELPPEFFSLMLGPQRKYSCCYYAGPASTLSEAEERALAETAEHAALADGQRILELGCGWGSLSLWMARKFPNAHIVSVSNSHSQRAFITQRAEIEALRNLTVRRGRHQRVCANRPVRSGRFSRNVRAHVELARAAEPNCLLDDAARRSLCPHFQSPAHRVPL